MDEHPNVERVRHIFATFAGGDMEATAKLFSDDMQMYVGGSNRFSGFYRGYDEYLGYLQGVAELMGEAPEIEFLDILADDRHGVAIYRLRATRGDSRLEVTMANAMTYDPQGRVDSAWFLPDDQEQMDRFMNG